MSSPPTLAKRVLMLGIDGLSTSFMRAPVVADNMPILSSLFEASATGPLWSTFPPYTGPAWTSITTGVGPGRHGVFGFTDHAGRPCSDTTVSVPRLWDYVGSAGGRSIVVNVPMTHPPRPIDGVLVSGMPAPSAEITFPPRVASELQSREYIVDIAVAEGGREGASTLDSLAEMTRRRGEMAAWLARSQPWDLYAIVFVLPDRLGHPWWKQLVPGDGLYESRRAERVRRGAQGALVALDEAIGALLETLPQDTAIVLCSDHGFGPLHADVFFDLVLAEAGLATAGPQTGLHRALARAGRSRPAQFAPRALHRWARTKAAGPIEPQERRAWTTPPYESGVRLADSSDEELRQRVTKLLTDLRTPDGRQAVKSVTRRGDLYGGSRTDEAADLLCEMVDETVGLHNGMHATTPWVSRDHLPWGTHASEGVVAISGVPASRRLEGMAPDIAPTVLGLLGLEAKGLDGRSLVALEPDLTPVAAGSHAPPEGEPAYTADQEAAVMEQLRSLGYVD
ncbi:MAG: alkaline phosphatase family protein [Actinobacteria bacterium]|nr:alkaline phosphatase family protein [Actinomycetota bacterium]